MTPNKKIHNHSFLRGLGELKFFDDNGNLLCYKNQSFLETGYIFVSYLPRIEDSSEFRPRKSMVNRYTQTVVNNSFYDTIEHDGA